MSDIDIPVADASPIEIDDTSSANTQIRFRLRPWDSNTDMSALNTLILNLKVEGVLWGATKISTAGFGVRDLIVTAVINEDEISTDQVLDKFKELDEFISRVDIDLYNQFE